MSDRSEKAIAELLALGDIELGGSRDFDVAVHDRRFFDRVLSEGTVGVGEAYMDGWWDCERIDILVYRLLRGGIFDRVRPNLHVLAAIARSRLVNWQRWRAAEVARRHYDIGNDLYEAMLDERMAYSCGYWRDADTLEAAQDAKLDLICRKLGLAAGQHLLDIGSGWGSLMNFAAERYGVSATGITLSTRQAEWAEARKGDLPVETRIEDYRQLTGRYDHVASVGMFEHVGYKNYRRFFEIVASLLADDGLFVLHTIGANTSMTFADPWITKYIFPNSMVPSIRQIAAAAEGLFIIEDVHNFGVDYDPTLMAWHARFEAAWPTLAPAYDERFHRMWRYYLMSMAGSFRARQTELWQIVLSKRGVEGGYISVR
jgi:cyclopropane-fatty-acyl-phospholipid synthase